MISTLILATALLQSGDSPRQRQVAPNGAKLFAERLAGADHFSLAIAFSTAAAPATEETHGWTHLLEHLLVKGKDAKLERLGMSLSAMTTRDALIIEIAGSEERLPFALAVAREMLDPIQVTEDEILRELRIIGEEQALVEGRILKANAAWTAVFAAEGLDPFGSLEAMGNVTPATLRAHQAALMGGRSISVAVTGALDPMATMQRLRQVFGAAPPGKELQAPVRSAKREPQSVAAPGASGSARAAISEGLDSRLGMSSLAAGFALQAAGVGQPSFQPSLWRGLVVVSASSDSAFEPVDRWTEAERTAWGALGLMRLRLWLSGQAARPGRLSTLTAALALQNPTFTMVRLQELAALVQPQDVGAAIAEFRSDRTVQVVGGSK